MVCILVGEQHIQAFYSDPYNPKFLKTVNYEPKPKFIPQPPKKYYQLSGKMNVSKDMMTSLIYESSVGAIITYFNGNFKIYDPIVFQQEVWWHQEMNLNGEERENNITFVTSSFSKKIGFLAIGGIEGRVFLFDMDSQSKIGVNEDVHSAEIVRIFFYDAQN